MTDQSTTNILIPVKHGYGLQEHDNGQAIVTADIARQIVALTDLPGRVESISTSTDTLLIEMGKRIAALEQHNHQMGAHGWTGEPMIKCDKDGDRVADDKPCPCTEFRQNTADERKGIKQCVACGKWHTVAADKPLCTEIDAPVAGPTCFMCGEPRSAHQPGKDGRLKCPPIVLPADQPAVAEAPSIIGGSDAQTSDRLAIKLRDMLEASKNGHWYGRMVTAETQAVDLKQERDAARAEADALRKQVASLVEHAPPGHPLHSCGGPQEACMQPGCTECGCPTMEQALAIRAERNALKARKVKLPNPSVGAGGDSFRDGMRVYSALCADAIRAAGVEVS